MRSPFRQFAYGSAISLFLITTMMLFSASSVGATRFAFSTFELSSTPGVVCPQKKGTSCTNTAAEPAIRVDRSGNFYASSENGLGAGTDAWRGSTNGLNYTALQSPNAVSNNNHSGFSPGGGDTDLAVAPAKNSKGNYNVYVASLNLANVDVSTSMDKGQTWSLNPTSATIPGDDREWIAENFIPLSSLQPQLYC